MVEQLAWTEIHEVEIVYKRTLLVEQMPKVHSAASAADLLRSIWNKDTIDLRESFKVLLLNRANRVMGVYHGFEGGISGVVADPRMIFACALKACASAILVAHNHPSGNLQPSQADRELTLKLVSAGRFLDTPVLDHLIISSESFYSFADEGLL